MRYSIATATLFLSSAVLAIPLVARQREEPATHEEQIFPYTEHEYETIKPTLLLPIFTGNSKSLERLQPSKKLSIFLGDPSDAIGNKVPVEAKMQFIFRDPTVDLDTSDIITKTWCSDSNDKITVTFGGSDALNAAKNSWKKGVVLVDAYSNNCGSDMDLHFKQISGAPTVGTDGKSLVYPYNEVAIEESVLAYEAGWGKDHKEAKDVYDDGKPKPSTGGGMKSHHGSVGGNSSSGNRLPPGAFSDEDWPEFGALPERVNLEDLVHANPVEPHESTDTGLVVRGDKSFDKSFPLPGFFRQDITFWRNPQDNFRIFCKGCGLSGNIRTSGHIGWNIKDGLTGKVIVSSNDLTGHLEIALQLYKTLSASADRAKLMAEISHRLSIGLPGLSLGGVITIGPSFQVIPFLNMQLATTGTVSIGADVKWDNMRVIVDIDDLKRSESVWSKPSWHPYAKVEAQIVGTAQAGVRFGLHLGITAFKIAKGFSLMNEAYIQAQAAIDWTAVLDDNGNLETGFQGRNNCTGVDFGISIHEHVYLDIDIFNSIKIDLWRMNPIHVYDKCWPYEEIKRWFLGGHQLSGIY